MLTQANVRLFSEGSEVPPATDGASNTPEGGAPANRPPPADPRVPRYMKNRIRIFGIPAEVTHEHLLEFFKEYGCTESDLSFKSQEETGNERGGTCFVTLASAELGEKLMSDADPETKMIVVNGHSLLP